jgi:hypothetical protein
LQSVSVPVCSTVLLTSPSIPTQGEDQLVSRRAQLAGWTVQLPVTAVAFVPSTL